MSGTDTSYTFIWVETPNDSSIIESDSLIINVTPLVNTNYFLEIKTERGCLAYDSVRVMVIVIIEENCSDQIPDAFTPDGDGVNDFWSIPCMINYPDAVIQVFNRWGAIVYDSNGKNYSPWDGTSTNGKELPIGAYYYLLRGTGDNIQNTKGTISLIR